MNSNAARLGDHHLCPHHQGADVLPDCAPTILIEGSPAARLGDQLACRSAPVSKIEVALDEIHDRSPRPDLTTPLDIIQTGEPTVLLEGKVAARFGDGTGHGGLIDQGAPTVLIGSMVAAGKRLRLMERLRLIDAARQKAAGMPDGPDKEALLFAASRLARNNKAVEHARLCDDVYNLAGAPPGWQRVTGNAPPFVDATTGFYSAIYRSEIDGSYMLAFRGTEPGTWQDWFMGNIQNAGKPSPQYMEAVGVAGMAHDAYGDNLGITGHSLGGGLASVASLSTGVPATTINAAGVHPNTFVLFGLDAGKADGLIDAYRVEGEVLTGIQEGSPLAFGAPNAIGRKHDLPALNADGSPRPEIIAIGPPNPVTGVQKALEAGERHSPEYVINGIEAQKSSDIATIKALL